MALPGQYGHKGGHSQTETERSFGTFLWTHADEHQTRPAFDVVCCTLLLAVELLFASSPLIAFSHNSRPLGVPNIKHNIVYNMMSLYYIYDYKLCNIIETQQDYIIWFCYVIKHILTAEITTCRVVSRVSAHGYLNITCLIGPYEHLPCSDTNYVEAATFLPGVLR